MAKNIGGGRALRVCDLCGGVDDHPRHVLAGGDPDTFPRPTPEMVRLVLEAAPADEADRLLGDLLDTGTSDRHMDCCRTAGCPDGSCNTVTAGAEDLRGADLLNHLTKEA
jgi:hypothetical protein